MLNLIAMGKGGHVGMEVCINRKKSPSAKEKQPSTAN